jgi:toxin-antitoxin system PIN domain toxin
VSISIDVNVLLYASTTRSTYHTRANELLQQCASGSDLFCIGWPTVMAYLRMVTHPAIVSPPLPIREAEGNVDALVRLPNVRLLSEQEGFWDLYRESTQGLVVRGKLVPDAHLATLLRQHGVRVLYTNDRDFRKFDFLEVRSPFEPVDG